MVSRDLGPSLCRLPKETLIVVPEPLWRELEPSEQTAILRHEIEHFRRGDLWWALAARLLAAVHWFNPCAWWAAAKFEEQAEFACDRAAAGEEPARFAELLLRLGSGTRVRTLGVQTMASGSLYQRVQRLAANHQRSSRWRSITPLFVTLFVMGFATVRFTVMPSWAIAEEKPMDTAAEPLPERAIARLGKSAFYMSSFPHDLVFSPDGKKIAIAETNTAATVRVYDVATARQIAQLTTKDAETWMARCVAFSPDGQQIVCGTTDGHVIVWHLANRKEEFNEELHDGDVNDVAYSPDGELLVTAGADGGLFVRSAQEPSQMIQEIKPGDLKPKPLPGTMWSGGNVGTGPRPISLAFTPDGTKLVVGYDMGKVFVWDPREGKMLHSFIASEEGKPFTPKQALHTVAVMPDGKTVLTAGFESIKRDTTDLEYGPKNVRRPAVRLWELDSGELIRGFIQPDEYGYGWAAISPNGKQIAIGQVGQLVLCNIDEDGKTLYRLRIPLEGQSPDKPAFSPDGKYIAVSISGGLALFNATTGERLHYDPGTSMGTVLDADWSSLGERIVTGSRDGEVRVWDADTGDLIWHRQLAPIIEPFGDPPRPAFVAFTPNGDKVIVAGERDDLEDYTSGIMVVYDAGSGKSLHEFDIPRRIEHGVISHDGGTAVLVGRYGGPILGVDVATGNILFEGPTGKIEGGMGSVEAIAFLPDSASFRIATFDSRIMQFDAATGRHQETHSIDWRSKEQKSANEPKVPQIVNSAFTPDAAILLSSSEQVVYRWDAATGKQLLRMEHPHQDGSEVTCSTDGRTIATSESPRGDPGQRAIRIYDQKGNELLTLSPNAAWTRMMEFSPDGSRLLTGFGGFWKAPIVWDVAQ